MPTADEWAVIRAAREMQNMPDPWERKCAGCGHRMRDHRLDLDDPMGGLAPDCGVVVTVVDPDTLERMVGPCPCMEFTVYPVS